MTKRHGYKVRKAGKGRIPQARVSPATLHQIPLPIGKGGRGDRETGVQAVRQHTGD